MDSLAETGTGTGRLGGRMYLRRDILPKEHHVNRAVTRLSQHTVEDVFDKPKFEEARLLESWSVYDSSNFIVTAHHLYYDSILCSQHMRSRSRGDSTYSLV